MISPYIKSIRERIGNDLLIAPAVTVLVFDESNRVLLVRHSNNNVWVAPGGMVEPDESPETAAEREMLEETGCSIKIDKLAAVFGGPDFRILYENGDQVSYVMIAFIATITGGALRPDGDETLEVRYFHYQEIKTIPCGRWLPVVLDRVFSESGTPMSM
jgi:ADP-ribose pyrophosphatase YjhB (NUDIX family)